MKLPKLAVTNYQFTVLFFILLLLFGVTSYLKMPQSENPVVYVPGASITVIYPGASPVDLEELIASPVEEAINELDDIKKINTTLRDGLAIISVEFIYDTDADEKFDEVVQKVNSIRNDLPDDILSLDFWQFSSSDVAMLQLAFVSDDASYNTLEKSADNLKKQIEKEAGVKKVELMAYPDEEVRVSLDMEKMAQINIGINDVIQTIQSNNVNIPGGSVNVTGKTFGVKTSGSYNNLNEIRNTVVNSYKGQLIYLKNIATVNFDYEDIKYKARFNGKRAIFMIVKQKEGFNIFDITSRLHPLIHNYKKQLPGNISLHTVFDQSQGVERRINGFMSNLLQGVAVVGVLILLALGFRSAIIVIIAIPLSVVIGLGFVDLSGLGLQQITIAALVVALGLLVDNSIVMVENINRFIALGYHPKKAATEAASQIGWAIVSATATTLLAFIPVIMMPDKAGDFIKGLPVTIIATLSVSLLIALTLSPLLGRFLLKTMTDAKHRENKIRQNRFNRWLKGFIEGTYRNSLNYALQHKKITLFCAIFVFLVSGVVGYFFVEKSFFPKAETPQLMIRVHTPEGASLTKTDSITRCIEAILDTIPEIKHYASNIGHGNPRIYYNVFSKNYTRNFADIYIETYRYDVDEFDQLINHLRNILGVFPGVQINVKEFEQGVPIDAPIAFYISGENIDNLKAIADDVEQMLINTEGAINVDNQLSKQRTDLYFKINKEKAGIYGVPIHEIDKTIRTAVAGAEIAKFRDDTGKEYDISVRLPCHESIDIKDFDKIYVESLAGKFIPLKQLATMEMKKAPGIISRYNLQRTAIITADLEKNHNLDNTLQPVIKQLDNYPFPPNYDYTIRGEYEAREETFGGMQQAVLVATVAVFAVLVLQFRSFIQPLIIATAIPLAIIGSVWALLITGYSFSFTAFIGLISLIGIVINNSIILVDYSNQLVAKGHSIVEAVCISGETRFTPILLTTLTTAGGLLPLTLQGGTLWAPMGWTIIGGLIVSTVLTLIVVPVLYEIFTRSAIELKQEG